MQSSRLEISRAALQHNYEVLRSAAGGLSMLPVVKANGYGLGIQALLPLVYQLSPVPTCLCVATLAEAYELRQNRWHGDILVLGAQHPTDVPEILALGARPWVMSVPVLRTLLRHGPPHIDLDFDLGMGRMGIHPDELDTVASLLHGYRGTLGVGTHHPNADRSDQSSAQRLAEHWQTFAAQLPGRVTERHSANTAATLNGLAPSGDTHSRCGIGLYGVDPRTAVTDSPLRNVVQLQGRVAEYRRVRPGDGLSYGHEFVAPHAMTVAVVTAGYADGLPIQGASQMPVYLGPHTTRIVGRVTMDTVLLDATHIAESARSEWATLLGGEGSSVRQWAASSGRSPYEILTGLGRRPQSVVVP